MRRSNRVDEAIKATWAVLATAAAAKAVLAISAGDFASAEHRMVFVERWLERAGADATRWHYSKPKT